MLKMTEDDNEVRDVLSCIRKEMDEISTLENDLSSRISASYDSNNKAETMLQKVRRLSKWAIFLNLKITEHCQSKGLSTENNSSLNKCCTSAKQIHVTDEVNEQPPASVKKSSKSIPSIRQFSDNELQSVPRYMKGRLTTIAINAFIEKFNTAIQTKYKILKKPKKLLTSKEKQYVSSFKDQETNLAKGNYFCTAEDIKLFCNYSFVNTSLSIIIILRHCKLIKEIREPKRPVKYCIVADDW